MHIFRRSIAEGGKDGSKSFVKRVTSTFSITKKKNTESTSNDPKPKPLFPRSKSTGSSNYASMRLPQGKKSLPDVTTKTKRIKSAGVSPQPRREKIDDSSRKHESSSSRNQFMKMRCFDDNESIWLASDCASSSSHLEERRVSVSFHFSVDEKIVSWLSNVANSSLNLNQESTKENHQHPHQTSSRSARCSPQKVRKDGRVSKSRGTSPAKPSSSSSGFTESNIKTWPSSSNKFTSCPDLTSQIHEEKKVNFPVDTEKSALPVSSSLEKVGDSKSKIVVEPLFWPLEQKFDWTPEDILKHFSMSPRRKKFLGSKSASTSPRSMRAQLQARKQDLKEGCKRKLMFNGPGSDSKPIRVPEHRRSMSSGSSSSGSKKSEMSKRQQPIRKTVKRNKSLPSRLSKSSKISSKVVPIEATTTEESGEILKKQKKIPKKLIMTRKSRTFLEDDFALMNDFSIENAVGLGEFKGREGIDSDFNTDVFLFDESL